MAYFDYRAIFVAENFYHIICNCTNNNKLFLNDNNRIYFLTIYLKFLGGFVDTHAYCLMDNHVHWMIKVKSEKEIKNYLKGLPSDKITQTQLKYLTGNKIDINELLQKQYNNFLVSYTRSYNIMYNRKGILFDKSFKRIAIKDDVHHTQVIVYIHANPLKHGKCKDFTTYKWSSYQAITKNNPTNIKREEVLAWFGGLENFIALHKVKSEYYYGAEE